MKSPKKLMLCRKHGDERDRLKKPEGSVLFDLPSIPKLDFIENSSTSTYAAASACSSCSAWHHSQTAYQSSINFINMLTTQFAAN